MGRRGIAIAVAGLAATGLVALGASAGTPAGTYRVRSIVLTVASTAASATAIDASGVRGRMETRLDARLVGTASGGPAVLTLPAVAGERMCSPGCPRYRATGKVAIVQTFVPDRHARKAVSCRSTVTFAGATGLVYVDGSRRHPGRAQLALNADLAVNDLYRAARSTRCALPLFLPGDDRPTIGVTTIPLSRIGARTIAARLRTTEGAPTSPFRATGGTTVVAQVVLARVR